MKQLLPLAIPASIVLLVLGCSQPPEAELRFEGEWPQWRGSTRDGHIAAEISNALADAWPTDGVEASWRRKIGPGFSSVAVSQGRLLVLEADGGAEWLIALDAGTGQRLWRQRLGDRYESFHGDGPRSTPAISGEVAVAMGALGGLVAVSVTDGSILWQQDLLALARGDREDWGFASSPLIDDGRVYVHGTEGVTALALDLAHGDVVWRLDSGPGGYASPLMAEIGGQRQLINFLGNGLYGLEPGTGDVLWRFDWSTYYDLHAADPIVLPSGEIYISSNYATGAGLIELAVGESGLQPRLLWESRRIRNHWSSSVLVGETIFGFDMSFLIAVDTASGEILWKQRGFGEGSLLAAGEHLVVVGEDGNVALGRASRDGWVELRQQEELVEGPVFASPVLVGGWLFLRGKDELAAFELAPALAEP